MFNNPADILSVVLRGAMGRSGRKRARHATKFLTGDGGFLTASSVLAAAGVAWGIYDSVKTQDVFQVPRGAMVPPIPVLPADLPNPVLQMIRLAAGLEAIIEPALTQTSRPLAGDAAPEEPDRHGI